MADPTFHQLRQWGRGRQAPTAPTISQIDPDAITVLDGPAPRRQPDVLAIGEVDPDALEVRNSRQRKSLRDLIASKEASGLGYDSYLDDYTKGHPARPDKPVSQMTLAEVYAYQDRLGEEKKYNPVGRYQIQKPTLQMMQRSLGIPSDRVFDAELQDRIADGLLTHRGFEKYVRDEISAAQFHDNLAKEWDAIEYRDTGKSFKRNHSRIAGTQVLGGISQIDQD